MRGAIYAGDGRAALVALERGRTTDTLQYAGDGILLVLAQGVAGAAALAARHVTALRDRGAGGDEDLAAEIDAAIGLAPVPQLRDLPVDLDELSLALEGDPLLTGGRLDLCTGEVRQIAPLFESEVLDDVDEGDGDTAAEADDSGERWLWIESLGSRSGYRDLEEFLATIDDGRLGIRLERAFGGRGAFRRFKDELADASGELDRCHRFTDDRRRGRARQGLAESGLRPAVPASRARP